MRLLSWIALLVGCGTGSLGSAGAVEDGAARDAGGVGVIVGGSDAGSERDDAAASDDASAVSPDAGAAIPDGRIPIFLAQGMVGRSTISCDDGRTWVGDSAWDDGADPHMCGSTNVRCDGEGSSCTQRWSDGTCSTASPCDCGHSPGFGKGVAFGGDFFVATWGWGWPGAVRRTRNGIDWETTLDNQSFGGIAYGGGRWVVAARDNHWSADGATWARGETADFSGPSEPVIWSVRRFGFADYDGGRFVAIASGNVDRDILVSSDGGESWWRPRAVPDGCGAGVAAYGGIVYGNGVIAIVGGGAACRSIDGGETWTIATITGDEIIANPIFTGTEFWVWSHYEHRMYRSEDAATWIEAPMETPTTLAAVARSPVTGTLVAVNSVWAGYEAQRFLRSTDGSRWETLPEGAFAPSHPIFHIETGYAERSAVCP